MKAAYCRERAQKCREHAQQHSGPMGDSFRDAAQVWENLAFRLEEIDRTEIGSRPLQPEEPDNPSLRKAS